MIELLKLIRESGINCGGQMKWPEILTCLPIGQLALKTTNKPMECWNDDTCLQTMQGVQSPSSAGSMTPFSKSTSKKLSRSFSHVRISYLSDFCIVCKDRRANASYLVSNGFYAKQNVTDLIFRDSQIADRSNQSSMFRDCWIESF